MARPLNRFALAVFLALAPTAAPAQEPALQQRVEARLAEAGAGVRFGLVVAAEDGREIVAIRPDERFIPASNTKMVTTAAAFEALGDVSTPDAAGGTGVRLEANGGGAPDVVLEGRGDARMSSAAGCVTDCLAVLADAVAAKTLRVRNVVGDDSLFPDQRWSPGMSWNNMQTGYGTAASALTLDDNEIVLTVSPGEAGKPPRVDFVPYYRLDNRAVTSPSGPTSLSYERLPASDLVRLTGTIAIGAEPERLRLGIDDPAHYAAWRLRSLLEARGVRVTGDVRARHRPQSRWDDPALRGAATLPRAERPAPLAELTPPPLLDDLVQVNKVSQNLHAELLLRRIGRERGSGSLADGLAAVRAMLERAGLPRTDYDFSDGSGMSTYNRLSPRGGIRFLRWVSAQPWGGRWRATLPIAGVDGTLARRFRGTALEGRLFAKTGSLNATNALSGYMVAKSGRTLLFSAFANDVPDGQSGTAHIDAALLLVAEAN